MSTEKSVAMKIKYEIEKYGGRVDVMTCTD